MAHEGGVSFRAAARGLMARNLRILSDLFPGYYDLVRAHEVADPLKPYRVRLDEARLLAGAKRQGAVLLISHSHGGGVARQVDAEMAQLRAAGLQPLLLTTQFPENPRKPPIPGQPYSAPARRGNFPISLSHCPTKCRACSRCCDTCAYAVSACTICWAIMKACAVWRRISPCRRTLSCMIIRASAHGLICLTGRTKPPPCAIAASPPRQAALPAAKSAMAGCRSTCPCRSCAPVPPLNSPPLNASSCLRPMRHGGCAGIFPTLQPEIHPWEDDTALPPLSPPRAETALRVAVIGGIGPAKGFDLLLDCAADAKPRHLPLDFIVIGGSADDDRLLAGRVFSSLARIAKAKRGS